MGQRESKLSRKIMDAIRKEGVFCFKVHGSEHMMAGLPDIIACVDGYFVGLEVKHPETKDDTTARQLYVHNLIRKAQGIAVIVTTVAEALRVIREIRMHLIDP